MMSSAALTWTMFALEFLPQDSSSTPCADSAMTGDHSALSERPMKSTPPSYSGGLNLLNIIGRKEPLFAADLAQYGSELEHKVRDGRFLVVGGDSSIDSAVVREIFSRSPQVLHVADISENNLAEVVRNIRRSSGYIKGNFRTFAPDCGAPEFAARAA
jgi:hypothetical protein